MANKRKTPDELRADRDEGKPIRLFPMVDEDTYDRAVENLREILDDGDAYRVVAYGEWVENENALGWLFEAPSKAAANRGKGPTACAEIPDDEGVLIDEALLLFEEYPTGVAGEARGKQFVVPFIPIEETTTGEDGATREDEATLAAPPLPQPVSAPTQSTLAQPAAPQTPPVSPLHQIEQMAKPLLEAAVPLFGMFIQEMNKASDNIKRGASPAPQAPRQENSDD